MREIIAIDECNDTYGRERMYQALVLRNTPGIPIPSERTVYRVMNEIGIVHRPKKKPNGITQADRYARKSDDLLKRDFFADRQLKKAVTDICLEENPGALPLLLQYGYEVCRHRVPLFVPDNWFGNRINVFIESRLDPDGVVRNKAIWSNNWLCVKPDGKRNVQGLEREPAQDELKAAN